MIRDIDILLTEDKKINQDIILGIFEKSRFQIDVAIMVVRLWRRLRVRSTHWYWWVLGWPLLIGIEGLLRRGLREGLVRKLFPIGGHLPFN